MWREFFVLASCHRYLWHGSNPSQDPPSAGGTDGLAVPTTACSPGRQDPAEQRPRRPRPDLFRRVSTRSSWRRKKTNCAESVGLRDKCSGIIPCNRLACWQPWRWIRVAEQQHASPKLNFPDTTSVCNTLVAPGVAAVVHVYARRFLDFTKVLRCNRCWWAIIKPPTLSEGYAMVMSFGFCSLVR